MSNSKSKDKGTRAEYQVRDKLREATGLPWERVPGSGGFDRAHSLVGDLYIPDMPYKHCIEVKHYKEDTLNSNLLNPTVSQLEKFWQQTTREAGEIGKQPLLVFKKDRGKWLVASEDEVMDGVGKILQFEFNDKILSISLLDEWLKLKHTEDFLE